MKMRPVDRGVAPRVYDNYQAAGPDLQQRIGDYCSYCERQIETNLAVEHIQPKSLVPALRNEWTNFLLACVNCNSSKTNTPISEFDYFWPDKDNTLRAFEYTRGGIVKPHPGLSPELRAKAENTIRLLGLDKDPGNNDRLPTPADRRWHRRQQAWEMAEKCKAKLILSDTPLVRELIVEVATGRGEFSIWWTVFATDQDIRRRLREAYTGTHDASFDENENPLAREGGQL
jgi:uncharacterized protein (TIGR02646 family)